MNVLHVTLSPTASIRTRCLCKESLLTSPDSSNARSGSLYSYNGNPRTVALLAVAKANALDVELVDVKPGDDKLVEKFPLGKVPGFVGADGYTLHECNAIAIYCKSILKEPGQIVMRCRYDV